jgi:MoaA/NifB/PqqE/SkfB family radical SAM enzyme
MKSINEQKYTSTTTKLLHQIDRLGEIKYHKEIRPISIQLIPTNKCSLSCGFCSVKDRNMKDEMSLEECKNILDTYKSLGAKTVEFSGGGDPTSYKYINDLINYAYWAKGYQIGMITNGLILNKSVSQKNLKCLTWLRISLNTLDYVEDFFLDIPEEVDLGFSYVVNDKTTEKTLEKVKEYYEKYNAKYVRIVPNCLSLEDIEKSRNLVNKYIEKYPEFFLQEKEYTVPQKCYIGYLKPYVYKVGGEIYAFPCSALALHDRKFTKEQALYNFKGDSDFYNNKVQSLNPDEFGCKEGKCFFREHNDLVSQLLLDVKHEDFI